MQSCPYMTIFQQYSLIVIVQVVKTQPTDTYVLWADGDLYTLPSVGDL